MQQFANNRFEFAGRVERNGIGKGLNVMFHTLLICDITHNGKPVADHAWVKCDNVLSEQFSRGDVIRFTATTRKITKGFRSKKNKVNGKVSKEWTFVDVEVIS